MENWNLWLFTIGLSSLNLSCGLKRYEDYPMAQIMDVDSLSPIEVDSNRICTQEQLDLFAVTDEGHWNVDSLKKLIKQTNTYCFYCINDMFYDTKEISRSVFYSYSLEVIAYYTEFPVTQIYLNEMLDYYLNTVSVRLDQHKEIIGCLVQRGAKIPVGPLTAYPPDHPQLMYRFLKNQGYDFNYQGSILGNTILIEIASLDHTNNQYGYDPIKVMKILLKMGCDPNIKNFEGKSALDVAVNSEVVAFLKKKKDK